MMPLPAELRRHVLTMVDRLEQVRHATFSGMEREAPVRSD